MNKLLVLILVFWGVSCSPTSDSVKPTYMALTESVYASGTVEPVDIYKVHSPISGILVACDKEEGEEVIEGEIIFKIQSENPGLIKANSAASLDLAERQSDLDSPQLKELSLRVANASKKYTSDSLNFERQKRLYAQDIGTLFSLEQAKLAFETSRNNYFVSLNQLGSMKDQLETKLIQASNSFRIQANSLNDYLIKSEFTGTVYAKMKEMGEWVSPQEVLAIVGSKDSFRVDLNVDELDIRKISIGQKVYLTLDAYPDAVYQAKIHQVIPILDSRTQTFSVKANFLEAPALLYPGLTVEANILLQTKEKALVVPKEYLHDGKYVYTRNKDAIEVQIGLSNLDWVEILAGIDTSTTIFKVE